ncbi:MAG: molybdenum cofactor guanylyltransferase MobA [Gallionellaceae bacterium]
METISVVILAGGMGSRIGGAKPLQLLQGRPLLEWVLESVRPQCDEVLISANDNPASYARFGCRVIADRMPDYAGPLAGLQSALQCARHRLIASVPCDTPFLPRDLIERLHASLVCGNSEMSVAMLEGRRQAAIALYHERVLPKLDAYLEGGGRKVISWQDTLQSSVVEFEDVTAFANINTTEELSLANQILHAGGTYAETRRAIT